MKNEKLSKKDKLLTDSGKKQIRHVKKYGRNELVAIQNKEPGDVDFCKYKRAEDRLEAGWEFLEI
jgi:hypothetical protein